MSILLDTHSFLWFVLDDPKLPTSARRAIAGESGIVYLSPASYCEIAIKISVGKYRLDDSYEAFWQNGLADHAIEVLPIDVRHTSRLIDLPFHHKDPFDRLLVAQASADGLPIVSGDVALDAYGIERLW